MISGRDRRFAPTSSQCAANLDSRDSRGKQEHVSPSKNGGFDPLTTSFSHIMFDQRAAVKVVGSHRSSRSAIITSDRGPPTAYIFANSARRALETLRRFSGGLCGLTRPEASKAASTRCLSSSSVSASKIWMRTRVRSGRGKGVNKRNVPRSYTAVAIPCMAITPNHNGGSLAHHTFPAKPITPSLRRRSDQPP